GFRDVRALLFSGKNEAIRRSSRMEAYVNVIRNPWISTRKAFEATTLEEIHNLKLLQAMSVLSIHARGPCAVETAKSLQEECNFLWPIRKHCAKKVHCEDEPHSSHFVYHSTCNCGRLRALEETPLALRRPTSTSTATLKKAAAKTCSTGNSPSRILHP
ncbi:Protein SMG8like, partial [Caligus rogercresseyi]